MSKVYGSRWEVIKSLDEGGQANAFLVKNMQGVDETRYVLKRLKNIKRIERFKREIEAVRNLAHENIVQLIDFDLEAEKPYLVTEYCSGGNLSRLSISDYEIIKRLRIFVSICRGVAYAHSKGVIHRDLKPENIFLRENLVPVVGDFGICYMSEEGERFTLIDEAVGPRSYTAPELEDGRVDQVSAASDVYSLGKLLYWILSGRIFSREKHREPEYDLSRKQVTPVFFMMNELLDKMIVTEPSKRFKDADEVTQNVQTAIERIESHAHVIDHNAPQHCMYCGLGTYQIIFDESSPAKNSLHNTGFNFIFIGGSKWLIMVCNHCGNVQLFRPDFAKNHNIWGK